MIPFFGYCDFGGNIGDRLSCPKFYFPEWEGGFSVYPPHSANWTDSKSPIIIGGGGLFQGGSDGIFQNIGASGRTVVVWGAGTNLVGFDEPWYGPGNLDDFSLVGVRDYGTKYPWVPCVSCLHPDFSRKANPVHDIAVYSHYDIPIPIQGGVNLTNDQASVEPVISAFLSAKTIITTSYHGAYWAMLLGRQVLVYKPNHNKFRFFRKPPQVCDESDYIGKATGEPSEACSFLDECRELNLDFHRCVKELLNEHD